MYTVQAPNERNRFGRSHRNVFFGFYSYNPGRAHPCLRPGSIAGLAILGDTALHGNHRRASGRDRCQETDDHSGTPRSRERKSGYAINTCPSGAEGQGDHRYGRRGVWHPGLLSPLTMPIQGRNHGAFYTIPGTGRPWPRKLGRVTPGKTGGGPVWMTGFLRPDAQT